MYIDLGVQGAVHRAAIRDSQKVTSLLVGKIAGKLQIPFDAIDPPFAGFTVFAILGVDLAMFQAHRDMGERDILVRGVHPHGHRRAGAERSQQQLIRRRSAVRAAIAQRLVSAKTVSVRINVLRELGVVLPHQKLTIGDLWT